MTHYNTQILKMNMVTMKLLRLTHGGNASMYLMNKFPILLTDLLSLQTQTPKTALELKLYPFLWDQQGLPLRALHISKHIMKHIMWRWAMPTTAIHHFAPNSTGRLCDGPKVMVHHPLPLQSCWQLTVYVFLIHSLYYIYLLCSSWVRSSVCPTKMLRSSI